MLVTFSVFRQLFVDSTDKNLSKLLCFPLIFVGNSALYDNFFKICTVKYPLKLLLAGNLFVPAVQCAVVSYRLECCAFGFA